MKRFEPLTSLIPALEAEETHGQWILDHEHAGTDDDPIQMPFVGYTVAEIELVKAVYICDHNNPDLGSHDYYDVLEEYGLDDQEAFNNADVIQLDARCVLAMILYVIRADRFCEGTVKEYLDNGKLLEWAKRLREIDDMEG